MPSIKIDILPSPARFMNGSKIEHMLRGGPGNTGEVHRWMYDRHSLTRLLSEAGFVNIRQISNTTSRIPEWDQQNLDARSDGGKPL